MKTESLREVKNNLSQVIEQLPDTGPILITKNGKGRAMLISIDNETDLEALILSTSRRFWNLFDRAAASKKWTPMDKL
jgi:prevent-host-death family protein